MEKIIEELFEKLNQEVVKYNPYYDKDLLKRAFLYAYSAHKGHLRVSKEPYIIHPLSSALKLTKIEADDISLVSALIHDVLKNKNYSLENIRYNFWDEVALICEWVNKLWNIYYTVDMTKQEVDDLKSQIVMAWNDIRIFLVKIADRYHNLETLDHLKKELRYRIAKETQEVYLPIVNFLSIWEFLTDMYDLCFKYTNEKEYNKLFKLFWKKMETYEEKIISTHDLLEKEFQRYWINVLKIEWRVKTLNSIHRKLQSKKLELSQIYDVLALRVVVKNLSECYLALGIIHKIFKIKTDRFKDYISAPKNNWYQSIHTTVYDLHWDFLEFQIQTEEMYKLNKTGLAAHFIYKWFWVDFNRLPKWMVETLNVQKKTIDSKKFLEKLNQEVIISEIKVFDKEGNRYLLPKESVLIDFAFSVNFDSWKYFAWAYINWVFINDPFHKLSTWDFINLAKLSTEIFTNYKVENFFDIKTKKAREAMKTIFSKYSKVKLKELWKYMLNNSLEIYWLRHFHYQPKNIREKIFHKYWVSDEDQLYLFLWIDSIDYNDAANLVLAQNSKLDFKEEILLKIFTKSYDFTFLNIVSDILYNLNVDVHRISYNKKRNYVNIKIKIHEKNDLENLISEIKRAPNVLDVIRVFPIRLKIYYAFFIWTLVLLGILSFILNMVFLSLDTSRVIIDIFLFLNLASFLFILFYLRYIVRKNFPDIAKYKRFYVSLSVINTLILAALTHNWLVLGFNYLTILYILIVLWVYVRLLYNYKNLKSVQKY